jgi:hypothetical protein
VLLGKPAGMEPRDTSRCKNIIKMDLGKIGYQEHRRVQLTQFHVMAALNSLVWIVICFVGLLFRHAFTQNVRCISFFSVNLFLQYHVQYYVLWNLLKGIHFKIYTTCFDQCGHHQVLKLLGEEIAVFFWKKARSTTHNRREYNPPIQTRMRIERTS